MRNARPGSRTLNPAVPLDRINGTMASPPNPPPAVDRLRRAAMAARSGLRRYPRHLLESLSRGSPGRVVPASVCETNLCQFGSGGIGAVWLGHATMLLSVRSPNGRAVTVLTDPVFSDRIGLKVGQVTFGLRRLIAPALEVHQLPPIDLVLLSHAHFDHLDRPSLRRLAAGPARGATVITAERTGKLVPSGFRRVIELPWNHTIECAGLRLDALRPAHWGARAAFDRRRGFNSYVIEAGARRVLFAGDTAATDAFERIGPVNLSIFGVGAYEPWEHAHATPEQVWRMFAHLRGSDGLLMPMHHSTFDLGEEQPGEPLSRLAVAAGDSWRAVVGREMGEVVSID
ncbi:MAG: MBL fold metallo-hydrolase [Phycisphaeraceae bacterium]|nr:MBL fold metallo-hydrolase [Phycisphaeraceae bacterium]